MFIRAKNGCNGRTRPLGCGARGFTSGAVVGSDVTRRLLIENGTIADADGTLAADVAIDPDAGEIVAVGDTSDATAEADEIDHIDASGRYVAPGLIDSHVHLSMDGRADTQAATQEPVTNHAMTAAANCRAAVENGVTTVRDLGSPGALAIDAATAVADGRLVGPRVVACGRTIVMTGGHGHWFGREADGPSEVRKAAREQLKRGAGVLKCMATGGVLTTGAQTGAVELLPDELREVADAARQAGVASAAHAHGATGIENAAEAGITSVEHGTFMDRSAAETLATNDTYWVPTASALKGIVGNPDAGIPADAMAKAEQAAEEFASSFEHADAAGVTVAMGTDAGTPFNDIAEAPRELEYMVEYGMEPADALRAATTNAADLLGLDDVGLIEAGYAADCVVLPENPREHASAYGDCEAVIADGDRVV